MKTEELIDLHEKSQKRVVYYSSQCYACEIKGYPWDKICNFSPENKKDFPKGEKIFCRVLRTKERK